MIKAVAICEQCGAEAEAIPIAVPESLYPQLAKVPSPLDWRHPEDWEWYKGKYFCDKPCLREYLLNVILETAQEVVAETAGESVA